MSFTGDRDLETRTYVLLVYRPFGGWSPAAHLCVQYLRAVRVYGSTDTQSHPRYMHAQCFTLPLSL